MPNYILPEEKAGPGDYMISTVEVPYDGKAGELGMFSEYIYPIDRESFPWLNYISLKYDVDKGLIPLLEDSNSKT
ncbi:MAG: hypothetical protein J7M18_04265 [Candidatus Eremiobacteraeota bacterium]|nr:hypothetical protein [Candidatus Eremiobacteraeota bacterium]